LGREECYGLILAGACFLHDVVLWSEDAEPEACR